MDAKHGLVHLKVLPAWVEESAVLAHHGGGVVPKEHVRLRPLPPQEVPDDGLGQPGLHQAPGEGPADGMPADLRHPGEAGGYSSSEEEWATESPWRCGSTLAAFWSKAERRVIVIRLRCGRLDCPRCGPKWRKQRLEHLRVLLAGHDRLYLHIAPEEHCKTLRDGLHRKMKTGTEAAGAPGEGQKPVRHGWARWRSGGLVTVIATVRHDLRGGRGQVEEISPAQALEAIGFLMNGLTAKGDFRLSHSWSLRRATKGYRLLGYCQGDLETARRLTEQFGAGLFRTWTPAEQSILPWEDDFDGFVADVTRDMPEAFPAVARGWWRWLQCKLLEKTLGAAA